MINDDLSDWSAEIDKRIHCASGVNLREKHNRKEKEQDKQSWKGNENETK